VPLLGGDGGDARKPVVTPSFYYVQPLSELFTFGLGINAPFGLTTKYDDDWIERYQAIRSNLLTACFNPQYRPEGQQ